MEENPDDPYDTLGVQRGATPERIKEGYDDKVRLHSDKDGGNLDQADDAMKAVTAADSILKDPEKGAEYDLSLGGGAGAAVSSKESVQASSSRGECLTERDKDGAQNEAGSSAAFEEAVGEGPDSQDVGVGNEETAAVVERKAEIEDEASGVDRAGKELLHDKGVATSNSTSDEIQPATDVSGQASTTSPAVVESAAGKLWRDSIEEKNPEELLRLLKADASNFWEHEREGRTALHVAAMGVSRENLELAKLILNELLKVRRRNYTEKLKKEFGNFSVNVRDYIEGVERESGKTAMKLAEENSERSATGKAICEHITVTLNLNEEHIGIDRAVKTQKKDKWWNYLEENLQLLRWSAFISSQNCNLLFSEINPSSDKWKYKEEAGRTVLHVAAIQGCFPLAQKMLDLAGDKNDREYIEAVDPQSNLTALQMADDIIGNRSIAALETASVEVEELRSHVQELEGKIQALKKENDMLIDRWMKQKIQDAERLNEANAMYEDMVEKVKAEQLQELARMQVDGIVRHSEAGAEDYVESGLPSAVKHVIRAHDVTCSAVIFEHGRKGVYSGGHDRLVKSWNVVSGACLSTLRGCLGSVLDLSMSFDKNLVIAACSDHKLHLWESQTGRMQHTLTGHTEKVVSVDVSKTSNRRAVSAAYDRTMKTWDMQTGGFTAATLEADGVTKGGAEKEAALVAATKELEHTFNKADFKQMKVVGQFNLGFILAKLDQDLFIVD